MSDVNVQLVRECFELNRFRVTTNWRPDGATGADTSAQLFVENPDALGSGDEPEFLLRPDELPRLYRALVEVRAWHADRFYPSVVEANPVLGHFATEESKTTACQVFGVPDLQTVLVISELPNSHGPRARALELLRGLGIDHVLEFSTVLADVVHKVSLNADYPGSHTLQTLRLLKRYRLVRNQQLEFTFSKFAPVDPASQTAHPVLATPPSDDGASTED